MGKCDHVVWLRFRRDINLFLQDEQRFSRFIRDLPSPVSQYLSMVFFLGRKKMESALRELFPCNNIRRSADRRILNLRLNILTADKEFPIFFSDGDFSEVSGASETPLCHPCHTLPIGWQLSPQVSATQTLLVRLPLMFTDVFYIFADDYEDLSTVAQQIKIWASIVQTSSPTLRPPLRILVAVSGLGLSATYETLEMEDFRQQLVGNNETSMISSYFNIKVVKLAGDDVSSLARYRRLKEILLNELDSVRDERISSNSLFSALHLQALYHQALDHAAGPCIQSFNFIRAARARNPVPSALSQHILRFLRLSEKFSYSADSLSRFIASALLMDAYPPGMHAFPPIRVYDELYKASCLSALHSFYNELELATSQNTSIKHYLEENYQGILINKLTSLQIRRQFLHDSYFLWRDIRNHRTCLFCICRPPKHLLICGYSICNVCLKVFGEEVSVYEYRFYLSYCILCGDSGYVIAKLRPSTAGIRILGIGGGGICGVIPLEFLQLLQQILGSQIPIQDLFDIVYGTSSGGLTALGLFLQGWDVHTCAKNFTNLGRQLFSKRKTRSSWRMISRFKDLFICFLSDGCYDIELLNALLQDSFGHTQVMFGTKHPLVSGTKVGVTATTISDASACIFPNYNGPEKRSRECGYRVIRVDTEQEPLTWEVGRATSAAPILFSPANISTIGSFQDGGLRHNNPVNLVLSEAKQIWSEDVQPDVVLSLGTGTEEQNGSPTIPVFRNIFKDGFLSRLTRSLLHSLNGEGPWRELMNRLDDDRRASFIRLNIPLPAGETVRLDDISMIDSLKKAVHRQTNLHDEQVSTIVSLLLSTFFFELDHMPVYYEGTYHCPGSLKCRYDARTIFNCLQTFSSEFEIITDTAFLGLLQVDNICNVCYRFRKSIILRVRDLTNAVPIYIRLKSGTKRLISGSPQSMRWYVQQQQLDAAFGSADHGIPGRFHCLHCTIKRSSEKVNKTRKRKGKYDQIILKNSRICLN